MQFGHPAQFPLTSVTFYNVIVFQCCSQNFNTLLAKYTEVKYQLKQSFYMNINVDKLWSKIDNVLQKRGV